MILPDLYSRLLLLLGFLTDQLGNLDCLHLANLLWLQTTQLVVLRLLLDSRLLLADLLLLALDVSVSVRAGLPLVMQRMLAHLDLLALSLLVASDHLVRVSLRLTLLLRLQITYFLLHLLQCMSAGRDDVAVSVSVVSVSEPVSVADSVRVRRGGGRARGQVGQDGEGDCHQHVVAPGCSLPRQFAPESPC